MKYKKRNPFIGEKHLNRPHDIAYSLKIAKSIFGSDNIKFLYLGGKGEETYLVTLKNNKTLDFPIDLTLKKGKYIAKFAYEIFSKSEIEGLKILSDLNLIPKIYYISSTIYIMKFVEGISVDRLISEDSNLNRGLKLYIYQNIEKELNLWHSMGFVHGDLFLRNVMISKEGKIWLIDPILYFGETGNFKEKIRNRDLKELAIIKKILTRI